MSDFYQTGVVATLHRLNQGGLARLEADLMEFSTDAPIALVLPALFQEFELPAMRGIASELRNVPYLSEIVVALGRATLEQFRFAHEFFDDFRTPVTFIWLDSPGMSELIRHFEDSGLTIGGEGKGRACWLAYGYVLARGNARVIASHDCDILAYDRELLARLCYPVANPNLGFEFCKGYYARVTERMHGRVTRLFLTPLIRAMETLAPGAGFLRFIDSFRYALAGESAMRTNLAGANRIPGDWGLEVGVLAEVMRNCSANRVCQVDLTDNYDHKHQDLSAGDPTAGLSRMACDIAKSIFRTMAGEGIVFTQDHFRSLQVLYVRTAEDTIHRYSADAMLNGLQFDRHEEERAVAAFSQSLRMAAEEFVRDPLGLPLIPNWNRVVAAYPDVFDHYLQVVEQDMTSVQSARMAAASK
jgi:glucosyl-3-phosphoglycerate synthase